MRRAILIGTLVLGFGIGPAEARKSPEPVPAADPPTAVSPFDGPVVPGSRYALAAAETTILASYTFDSGAGCTAQGWTVVDATAQVATFWHVDDFAGVNVDPDDSYAPLAGTKSLWCGARVSASGPTCGYLALPGCGNHWNQTWQTQACIPVAGDLDVSFLMEIDSEPGYDAVFLEYTTVCPTPAPLSDWDVLDGGIGEWDGQQSLAPAASYAVAGTPVKVRVRFSSDGAFSDEDGLHDSHAGPVVIDNLLVEGLSLEDFEGESVGATTSEDWEAGIVPGYGASYMALFSGESLVQDADPCVRDLSCLWAAIAGSTANYACGGYPQQAVVPYGNAEGQYLDAEIRSPLIPLTGSGSVVNFAYSVYKEGSLDNLIVGTWAVRSIVGGCAGPWRDSGFFIPFINQGWVRETRSIGHLIDASAGDIQVMLGVADMCGVWCGISGSGDCHTHTPLYDNVSVYRVDIVGPAYSTRDIDMFQDTFPSDGSDTGIGRADAALSITAMASSTILPGDSARVICRDPITAVAGSNPSGLATDDLGANNGEKACYLWAHVLDNGVPSLTKTGAALTDTPALYPFKDTQVAGGKTWTRIQCWLRTSGTSTFVVDLNDNLFEAGDVIEFFFGATNTLGQTSYCSGSALNYVQSDVEVAAETASEFTILPLNGNGTAGNETLYVDGMDGRGAQIYWDTVFDQIVTPDRYDVRGPTSGAGNRPGARVTDVASQLNANYQAIVWDCGDLTLGLGDGSAEKSNDYAMINQFLAGLTSLGGVYISGDNTPTSLLAATGAAATTFRSTYITFTSTAGDHRPLFGISPTGVGNAATALVDQTFVIYGGCPLLNDFDVMTPSGGTEMAMGYGTPATTNGAVLTKTMGNAHVWISGFSAIYIRDDEADGIHDRAHFLAAILRTMNVGNPGGHPTDVPAAFANRLEQNYPNPFNPQTTVAFSLKQRGRVRIHVYDVTGAVVRTLLDEMRAAGAYTDVRWDGTNDAGQPVASGVYWYRLASGSFSQARKMVLLR